MKASTAQQKKTNDYYKHNRSYVSLSAACSPTKYPFQRFCIAKTSNHAEISIFGSRKKSVCLRTVLRYSSKNEPNITGRNSFANAWHEWQLHVNFVNVQIVVRNGINNINTLEYKTQNRTKIAMQKKYTATKRDSYTVWYTAICYHMRFTSEMPFFVLFSIFFSRLFTLSSLLLLSGTHCLMCSVSCEGKNHMAFFSNAFDILKFIHMITIVRSHTTNQKSERKKTHTHTHLIHTRQRLFTKANRAKQMEEHE